MRHTRTRCKERLTVDQCIAAIAVLENEMLESPPAWQSAILTLAKIAQAWTSEEIDADDDCRLVKACRDKVYIDRSGGETIIYSRKSGTYSIGYPTLPEESWATL